METKMIITIYVFLTACIGSTPSEQISTCRNSQKNRSKQIQLYDTISCGSEYVFQKYRDSLSIKGTIVSDKAILYKTKGKGQNIWLKDIWYFARCQDKFIGTAPACDQGSLLFYFNEDSLYVENWLQTKHLSVMEYIANNFRVIRIEDDESSHFDQISKNIHFYKFSKNGINEKQEYLLIKNGRSPNYNFHIDLVSNKDSIIILKDGEIDYVYK